MRNCRGIEARIQLLARISRRRVKLDLLDVQRRLAPDHLHRLGQPFPQHRRAQDVVPVDHRLQGARDSCPAVRGCRS